MTIGRSIFGIYQDNPVTNIDPTDIFWGVRAPYTAESDFGILASNLLAAFVNLPVIVVTASSQQLVSNIRYFVNRPSLVMLTLPLTSNVGDVIEIVNMNNSWQLAQNTGQNITISNKTTTTGDAGYIQSSNNGDSIRLDWNVL